MERFFRFIFLFLGVFPHLSADFYYVVAPVADLHKDPYSTSEIVNQAIHGTEIQLLDRRKGWHKVALPDGYQGWIASAAQLHRTTAYPNTRHILEVRTIWTHLYSEPDTTTHPPLATYPFETLFEVLSSKKDLQKRWINVRTADGKTGWVEKHNCRFSSKLYSLDEMLAFSQNFMGLPYYWGGASGFGYDCSGFIQMLFRQMGITLPRDAKDQAASHGLSIEREKLLPGDVVFFGPNKETVTHVGLYLGEERFIHSPTGNIDRPGIIQISQFDEMPLDKQFVTARRFH